MAIHVKTLAVMRIQLVAMLFLTAAGFISFMVPLYLLLFKNRYLKISMSPLTLIKESKHYDVSY